MYVPEEGVEAEVVTGLHELLGFLGDEKGFAHSMNEELQYIWEVATGHDPDTTRRLAEVEKKIANTWTAIEDGLTDTATANARLRALQAERDELQKAVVVVGEAPQVDAQMATAYQRQAEKMLAEGTPAEKKQILRTWVAEMKLAPEALEVEMTYRIPEPVMHSQVAGACYVVYHDALSRTRFMGGWG